MDHLRHICLVAAGGAVLEKFERLRAAADASAHNSPAQMEFARFQHDWTRDPAAVTRQAEVKSGGAVEEVEPVARVRVQEEPVPRARKGGRS